MSSDVVSVIARLKSLYKVSSDRDLAKALGVRSGAVANWRGRKEVPLKRRAAIAAQKGVSLEWLTTGCGHDSGARDTDAHTPDMSSEMAEQSRGRAAIEDRAGGYGIDDSRLAAIIAWLRTWWEQADEEQRTWAVVQIKRGFPESEAWIRRWLADHACPPPPPYNKESDDPDR